MIEPAPDPEVMRQNIAHLTKRLVVLTFAVVALRQIIARKLADRGS